MVGKGFENAARSFARAYKLPDLRLHIVDDTVAHQGGEKLNQIAQDSIDSIASEWSRGAREEAAPNGGAQAQESVFALDGDFAAANWQLLDRGVTDGLPVILPTPELVERFVAASGRRGDEVIARLMPRMADATVERIAANVVMAGCKPEMMPILVAAVKAMENESFSINHVLTTAHTLFPLVVVNGPIAKEVGMTDGRDLTPKGWHPSASIGRAVRLILNNCASDMETRGAFCQGTPGKGGRCDYRKHRAESVGAAPRRARLPRVRQRGHRPHGGADPDGGRPQRTDRPGDPRHLRYRARLLGEPAHVRPDPAHAHLLPGACPEGCPGRVR